MNNRGTAEALHRTENTLTVFEPHWLISNFGIMYSQFGVGPLLCLCCSSYVPLLYTSCPPNVAQKHKVGHLGHMR